MHASLLLLLVFWPTIGYIVELELAPLTKSCVSELFDAGEPISITASMHDKPSSPSPSAYITIETEQRKVLTHTRYDFEANSTTIIYNNSEDQSLIICIDNFEDFPILMELNIKAKHHHTVHEVAPTRGEYEELNQVINEATNIIDQSYSYFKQNEEYSNKIIDMSGAFEIKIVYTSLFTVAVLTLIGWIQSRVVQNDMKANKMF